MKAGRRCSCYYCPAPTSRRWWAGEPRLSRRGLEEGERSLSSQTGRRSRPGCRNWSFWERAWGHFSPSPQPNTALNRTGLGIPWSCLQVAVIYPYNGHSYPRSSFTYLYTHTLYKHTYLFIHMCVWQENFFYALWIYSSLINPTSIIFLSSVPETPLPLMPPARLGWETSCVLNRQFATVFLTLREKHSVFWDCKRLMNNVRTLSEGKYNVEKYSLFNQFI